MLTDRVWEALVKSFASQMKSAFTASSFVKEIFTVGYPKLFSMIENLLERISRDTDVKGVPPALTSEGKDQLVSAIEIFQTAFSALCLTRLSDLVNSVFPISSRGSVPSREHILRIVSRIQEEIEAVQMDIRLTLLVLREINKVLLLLAEKAEYQVFFNSNYSRNCIFVICKKRKFIMLILPAARYGYSMYFIFSLLPSCFTFSFVKDQVYADTWSICYLF